MRWKDTLILAVRGLRQGYAITYMLALALVTVCVYFAGAIWTEVQQEKSEPCELTVTASGQSDINDQTIQDFLKIDGVTDASGLLEVYATVTGGDYTASLTLIGIDENYLDLSFSQGGMFPAESVMPWIVLSERAAMSFVNPDKNQSLKAVLKSVDWLNTEFTLETGEIAVTAKVSGLTDEDDEIYGYISQYVAKSLLQRQGQTGAYTSAIVRITDSGAAEAVTAAITDLGYWVENMDTERHEKWDSQLQNALYLLLLGIMTLVCTGLIKKIGALKNQGKNREKIHAMRWMGMETAHIRSYFSMQSLCLSVGGAVFGILASCIVAAAIPLDMRDSSVFAITLPAVRAAVVLVLCAGISYFAPWLPEWKKG